MALYSRRKHAVDGDELDSDAKEVLGRAFDETLLRELYNESSYSFPVWACVTPFEGGRTVPVPSPVSLPQQYFTGRPPTTNALDLCEHGTFAFLGPTPHRLPTANALDSCEHGPTTFSELTKEPYDLHLTNQPCPGLPIPVTMTAPQRATDTRRKVVSILRPTLRVIFEKCPQQIYLAALLHLPYLYFTRVSRILEDAELTVPKVRRLYTPVQHAVVEKAAVDEQEGIKEIEESLSVAHFKATWESFVDSTVREWKALNVISALLLSCVEPFH